MEEEVDHFVREQRGLVPAEGRHVGHGLIQRQVHEPAEEQIGLPARTELALAVHRLERLQHLPLQQRLHGRALYALS
jgi:hypothetical protein